MVNMGYDYIFYMMFISTIFLGSAAGILSVFIVLGNQSLLGDAISHAAFPGIALAFLITDTTNPIVLLFGGVLAGLCGAGLVPFLMQRTPLKKDAVLGVILSVFFGIGLVLITYIHSITTAHQALLHKLLFGNAATLLPHDMWLVLSMCIVSFMCIVIFFHQWSLIFFDDLFARVSGYRVIVWRIFFQTLCAVVIVIGLQTVGVVLMSAMLIAPAAAARQWTNTLSTMSLLSALFGGVSCACGSILSCWYERLPTGPLIVVLCSIAVLFSLVCAPKRGFLFRKWNDI